MDGTVTLSNRPPTSNMAVLENDGTAPCIPRDRTYASTNLFLSDKLSSHAGRLSTHGNVAIDAADCRTVMASQVGFRAVAPEYIHPVWREGPFHLQFAPLHGRNIFVDEDWNMRSIVDLEWISATPLERMHVPHWIAEGDLATFKGEQLDDLTERRRAFMEVFEEEERKSLQPEEEAVFTKAMNWTWENQGSWFWTGIESVNALDAMFRNHVGPR